ncbi:VOC family protein [Paracoccus binzhouensis]|uniref:VOC family protein n=1 Tax=Paracoccus binzhouensis TaxID=2796149 RepID=UPI0018EEDB5D|nr:VOC family protein [Paracoccus binzhouensis]
MKYLHTMVRVSDIETSLHFYCELLGMVEVNRIENPSGRFTLIFLAADEDETAGRASKAPLLELTYNWPDQNGETENIRSC